MRTSQLSLPEDTPVTFLQSELKLRPASVPPACTHPPFFCSSSDIGSNLHVNLTGFEPESQATFAREEVKTRQGRQREVGEGGRWATEGRGKEKLML